MPRAWGWGVVSSPHLLAQLFLFRHQWEKGWRTPSQPGVDGFLGTLSDFGSSSECARVAARESDPHSWLLTARKEPRRQWGINYSAAMASATRPLGMVVQAEPPELCCHHPGHSWPC